MVEDDKAIEKIVLTELLRLNAVILGLITGLVAGTIIFVATNWLVLKGGEVVGPHLSLLNQFFIGYEVTLVGSLIGFAYGFVGGFIIGYVIARLYNWIANFRDARASL
ncbi:MAG: hypothetical protein HY782_24070 [Chloroflexi bacterium]|nr:hypothetical protein [Chloroflexota bacterium]